MHLHDPAVPALLIDPALFEMRMLRIDVKTEGASAGQIRVLSENDPGGAFINCAVAVDAVRGMQFLRQRLLVF